MHTKPNIIIKAGTRAKWYLKRCPNNLIHSEIEKQTGWRDISRTTMSIIHWDGIPKIYTVEDFNSPFIKIVTCEFFKGVKEGRPLKFEGEKSLQTDSFFPTSQSFFLNSHF